MDVRKRCTSLPEELSEDQVNSSGPKKKASNHRINRKRLLLLALLALGGLFCLFIWAYPSPVSPVSFSYSDDCAPDFVGPLAVNNCLKGGKRLFENEIIGPESLTLDREGDIYTGLSDGRIIKISKDLKSYSTVLRTGGDDKENCGEGSEEAEDSCGRPLGLVFSKRNDRELFVTDSSLGLLMVNIDTRTVETLLSKKNCHVHINFLNDLVELGNGTLLITDSSLKFGRHDLNEALECGCNGQLLAYEPSDGSVRVLLRDLFFPNGLHLADDGESVLFVETTRARVRRYYYSGSKAGNVEMFSENLPCLPDNISPSLSGGYWLGSALVRTPFVDFFSNHMVSFRSLLAKFHLMELLLMVIPDHGLVLKLDDKGCVVRSLHDKGGHVSATSQILELRDGELLIGSYKDPYLIHLRL